MRSLTLGIVVSWAVVLGQGQARADAPEILSVEKIWDAGAHNAFTDLVRWKDAWYCAFREADGHVGGDGTIRVLTSKDGKSWSSAALIAERGIDLRDPKFSVTPDGRLMIVAGGSVYQGKTLLGRQPRVTFSNDGRAWTEPRRVLSEGEWLWRVTWHGDTAYGVSYHATPRGEPGSEEWTLKLFQSKDGVTYELVTNLDVTGNPNETTLRFLPDQTMVALVRREAGDKVGWIGASRPPYKEWSWAKTSQRLGGPNFLRLPDGTLWAAGRLHAEGAKTALARMDLDGTHHPVLTLPSGGDTSYPGLVWHDGVLWMSYYSSHEGKTSIYLARIKVPQRPEEIGRGLEPFVDDFLIETMTGTTLQARKPTAREVVLVADKPWEGNTSAYFTVFQDGDRYRMYYRGSHFDESKKKAAHPEVTCYAESQDGRNWVKPELGIVEFEGSRQNNVVWSGRGGHNFAPFRDENPDCPPDSRYKALAGDGGGLVALKSADGLRWSKMTDRPVITKGAFDSQNIAFFDTVIGKYREYHRAFRGVRDIMTGTSDDFLHWTDPSFLEYPDAPREHLYTNAVIPYPNAPHVLIGFPTRFLPATQQTEPTFMASRDGHTFHRFLDAVIPTTAPKDRDGNRCNY
ncbi:MAG: hypothetical protein AB7I30_06015, partial [Isosphaeraceae bacterium]